MITEKNPIESAFDTIMQSEVFRTDGPSIALPEALALLGEAIRGNDTDENTWSLGECLECDLGSLIVGAYWALTEWHAGQSSPEYRALSILGEIFSPGTTSGPELESAESIAYELVSQWFEERHGGK